MTDTRVPPLADQAGTVTIGGHLRVHRLGFGTMQLPGPGVWQEPQDRDGAIAVLRRVVELGVNFIDTADSYGPFVAEDLIRDALHPYPSDLVIATKGGLLRRGPVGYDDPWPELGRPEYLRQCVEMSLRRLGLETIDLYQLHRIDPQVPLEDSLGELAAMRQEGKIRHLGVSEVSVDTLRRCQAVTDIATVQNRYNFLHQVHEPVLRYCEAQGLIFIPWDPLASGDLLKPGGVLEKSAVAVQSTPAEVAIGWLLSRSPAMLLIPGSASLKHVEDNIAAAGATFPEGFLENLAEQVAH